MNFYLLEPRFEIYSLSHNLAIAIIFLGCISLYFFRKKLSETPKADLLFRGLLTAVLIGGEIILQYWYVSTNQWKKEYSLPLQLCDFSIFASTLLLVTGYRKIFEIVYFTGIGGGLIAVLSPELWLGFPHFRYYHFFGVHAALLWTGIYFIAVRNYTPSLKSLIRYIVFLNLFGAFVFCMNIILDANYMFISKPTYNDTVLNHLGHYPWSLLSMEGLALLTGFILCLPFLDTKVS